MIALTIRHRTTYRYHQPVQLGPHRLMLRPRESRDLRLVSNDVTIRPAASVSWAHDVFGNAVATATFRAMTDHLVIDSISKLSLGAEAWPIFDIAASAIDYPFLYADDEWTDLGALASQQYVDTDEVLKNWARAFVRGESTDTLALLKDLCAECRGRFAIKAVRSRGRSRHSKRSILAWGPAGILPSCSSKLRAVSASGHESSRATSTIPTAIS